MYDFTHSVYISHINNYVIFSSQMLVSLRSFVVKQLLSRIYALPSVKFSGLKLWLCKKSDKYEVWGGIGGLAQVCEARVSRFPGSGYKMKLVESEGESNQIF